MSKQFGAGRVVVERMQVGPANAFTNTGYTLTVSGAILCQSIPAQGNSAIIVSSTAGVQCALEVTQAGQAAWLIYSPVSSDDLRLKANAVDTITFLATGGMSIATPTSGNPLAIAMSGGGGVTLKAASGQNANLFIAGNGVATGTQGLTISHTSSGAFIQTNTTDGLFFSTNGITRVTVGSSGNVTMTGTLGINGAVGSGASSGWGAPTGAAVVANFPGATATLVQCSNVIAALINGLKNFGLLAT